MKRKYPESKNRTGVFGRGTAGTAFWDVIRFCFLDIRVFALLVFITVAR